MSAKRLVVVGAESTGKTTLCQDLAERTGLPWVPEYGRDYTIEKYGKEGPGSPWKSAEFAHIARVQQEWEARAEATGAPLIICDTNAWATGLWHERYMGTRDPETDAIGATDRADFYILDGLDVPFEPDDIRDGKDYREWMHDEFKRLLEAGDVPWLEVTGSREERIEKVLPVIGRLLNP